MSDLRALVTALHAVSTSAPMPRWTEYVHMVESSRARIERTNAPAHELGHELSAVVRRHAAPSRPFSPSAARLVCALVSFADDYDAEPPLDLFAIEQATAVLDRIARARWATIPAQLELALEITRGELANAVLALHTATRVLARGRDSRLHQRFALSLEERMCAGRAIAPFHASDARGGDPLGDTYHYWANVAAGLYGGEDREARRMLVAALMYAGPLLMSAVRGRLFGNVLFYGNHARIDRMGLAHGFCIGRMMRPRGHALAD
jgi:hypothetical protein